MVRQPAIRRILTRNPTLLGGLLGALLALAVPTVVKLGLDLALSSVPPFLTYFPAVTVAALCLGYRWGAVVLAGAAGITLYLFMSPRYGWAVSANDLVITLLFLVGGAIILTTTEALRTAARSLEAAAGQQAEMNRELKHRVHNNLAVVQAIAAQVARSREDVGAFYADFQERLITLSKAHQNLSQTNWASCEVPDLVESALSPFEGGGALRLAGPPCSLPSAASAPLALALHELGVNALKYGALSTPAGRIEVDWRLDGDRFVLDWRERDGPPVVQPTRRGLGARLLRPQHGLDTATVAFEPDGVRCRIEVRGAQPAAG